MALHSTPSGSGGSGGGGGGSGGLSLWYETIADQEAVAGASSKREAYNAETDGEYVWYPGATDTVDDFRILSANGGTAGVWRLKGDRISISPLGDGADDWPRFIAACTAMEGMTLEMRAGNWVAETFGLLPNGGLRLIMQPGVIINQDMPTTQLLGACLSAKMTLDNSNTTTVATANNVGERVIELVDSAAAGSYIYIQDGVNTSRAALYRVESVSGSDPYQVTVDRPIMWQFNNSDNVYLNVIPVQGIHIEGNGAIVTGTGDRFFEFQGAINCSDENLNFRGVETEPGTGGIGPNSYWHSWDAGSYQCESRNLTSQGIGLETPAIYVVESGECVSYKNCSAVQAINDTEFSRGFALFDSYRCSIIDCEAVNGSIGCEIGAQDNTITNPHVGCLECSVIGGYYNGNSIIGLRVGGGSLRTLIDGVSMNYNATHGAQTMPVTGFNQPPDRTRFVNCTMRGNTNSGLNIGSGTVTSSASGIDVSGNGSFGMIVNGSIDIDRLTSIDTVTGGNGNVNGIMYAAIGSIHIRGFTCQLANNGGAPNMFDIDSGVSATFIDGKVTCPGSTVAFRNGGARLTLENVEVVFTSTNNQVVVHDSVDAGSLVVLRDIVTSGGGVGSKGYTGASGCTLRCYGRVQFDSIVTAYTINAMGYVNRSAIAPAKRLTLNGATPVVINFFDLDIGEVPKFTLVSFGGTGVGGSPEVTVGAGNFSCVGKAGDTSVWDWEV